MGIEFDGDRTAGEIDGIARGSTGPEIDGDGDEFVSSVVPGAEWRWGCGGVFCAAVGDELEEDGRVAGEASPAAPVLLAFDVAFPGGGELHVLAVEAEGVEAGDFDFETGRLVGHAGCGFEGFEDEEGAGFGGAGGFAGNWCGGFDFGGVEDECGLGDGGVEAEALDGGAGAPENHGDE